MLLVAVQEFEKEEDSNKIYAFAGSFLALVSLCVSIVCFAWGLNAKNAIGTLCCRVTHGIIIPESSIALHTCDSPVYLLHPAQESYLGISFLRRLLLSLTDSLPKTLVSGYSYHRASIKRHYIITFYLKKLDLFYNSFHFTAFSYVNVCKNL